MSIGLALAHAQPIGLGCAQVLPAPVIIIPFVMPAPTPKYAPKSFDPLPVPKAKSLKQIRKKQNENETRYTPRGADYRDIMNPPESRIPPEQSLWRGFFLQMFTDAMSHSKKEENRRFKRDAIRFLRVRTKDFDLACEMAGFDADYFWRITQRFLDNNEIY